MFFMIESKIKSIITPKLAYLNYALNVKRQTKLSSEKAMNVLRKYNPERKAAFRQNNTMEPTIDLQIIVPIYNVEKYLIRYNKLRKIGKKK